MGHERKIHWTSKLSSAHTHSRTSHCQIRPRGTTWNSVLCHCGPVMNSGAGGLTAFLPHNQPMVLNLKTEDSKPSTLTLRSKSHDLRQVFFNWQHVDLCKRHFDLTD